MALWGAFDIAGKNVAVTGAALGIGFGVAKRFVEGGANVLLCDVDERALFRAADRLKGGPGAVRALVADVADEDTPREIVAHAVNDLGSLDVLVNSAGISPGGPMTEVSLETSDRLLDIHLRGLALISRAAGKRMVDQGNGGRIIHIGSTGSLHPSRMGLAAHDAPSGGVLLFTKSLALEMAPHGVLVNAILPGGVTTEGAAHPLSGSAMSPEEHAVQTQGVVETTAPPRRMGEPDDIAKVAVFLASPAAYMTGAHVVVDGGMRLA